MDPTVVPGASAAGGVAGGDDGGGGGGVGGGGIGVGAGGGGGGKTVVADAHDSAMPIPCNRFLMAWAAPLNHPEPVPK